MKIREDGVGISETGTWNQADVFSYDMIMELIKHSGIYLRIARTGFSGINEKKEWDGTPVDILRIEGFEWLVNTLIDLIRNTKFVMKKKGSMEKAEKQEKKLIKIKNIIPTLCRTINNQRTNIKTLKIINERYETVLEMVAKIRSEINTPLNQNNLIFIDKEIIDPKVYEKKIMYDLTHRG